MEDQISATGQAIDAWIILNFIDPGNELLDWLKSNKKSEKEFKDYFWKKERPWQDEPVSVVSTTVETNYFLALRKELKGKYHVQI